MPADPRTERAVTAALRGSVAATGQACQSIERIYVARPLYEEFVARLVRAASAVRLNWPDIASGDIGPIIHEPQSGIIAGLGETNDEIVETLADLRAHGVDVVTIGQYLQPSSKHVEINRWVHPDEFRWLREQGEALGFGSVFAGPLVRSSYRADEQKHAQLLASLVGETRGEPIGRALARLQRGRGAFHRRCAGQWRAQLFAECRRRALQHHQSAAHRRRRQCSGGHQGFDGAGS
jgi:hypothetical protein